MQLIHSPTFTLSLAALALIFSVAVGGGARAGIKNLDTGEQCWGGDCSDMAGVSQPSGQGGDTGLANVSTYDCNDGETNKINNAVEWLSDNMAALDGQMGRNGLMDWPGNSRKNFKEKLGKELKFYCINDKKKCADGGLKGKTYPAVAQKRINICAQNIRSDADDREIDRLSRYIHTIAHEISHLVRWNGHRSDCYEKYTNPRFSKALGLAAEVAHRGIDYDASEFFEYYCPPVETSSPATWDQIIDNKLQEPPLTVQK